MREFDAWRAGTGGWEAIESAIEGIFCPCFLLFSPLAVPLFLLPPVSRPVEAKNISPLLPRSDRRQIGYNGPQLPDLLSPPRLPVERRNLPQVVFVRFLGELI